LIIIISKTALFEPENILPDLFIPGYVSESDHLVCTSWDFVTIIFYTEQSPSALRRTHNLEDQVSVFMFPSDRDSSEIRSEVSGKF
jgi:hypothetical protein